MSETKSEPETGLAFRVDLDIPSNAPPPAHFTFVWIYGPPEPGREPERLGGFTAREDVARAFAERVNGWPWPEREWVSPYADDDEEDQDHTCEWKLFDPAGSDVPVGPFPDLESARRERDARYPRWTVECSGCSEVGDDGQEPAR